MLTHDVPDEAAPGTVRFVNDVAECARWPAPRWATPSPWCTAPARRSHCLRAGELDEIELHIVPVLLGRGRRLFDHFSNEHVELELERQMRTLDLDDPGQHALHLRYRVRRH